MHSLSSFVSFWVYPPPFCTRGRGFIELSCSCEAQQPQRPFCARSLITSSPPPSSGEMWPHFSGCQIVLLCLLKPKQILQKKTFPRSHDKVDSSSIGELPVKSFNWNTYWQLSRYYACVRLCDNDPDIWQNSAHSANSSMNLSFWQFFTSCHNKRVTIHQ